MDGRLAYFVDNVMALAQLERASAQKVSDQLEQSLLLSTFLDDVK